MKIVIKGKPYPLKSIEEVDLWDLVELGEEGKALGRDWSMAAIQDIEKAIQKLKHKDPATQTEMRSRHPDALLLMGISIWATLRCAGEKTTLREAMATSMAEVSYLREADDVQQSADPTSARPASGRAVKAARKRPTPRTSARR